MIFESSRDNGWLIAQLAAAGVSPRASSHAVRVYEVMSFNGDFSYLERQGIAGFQAAFVESFAQYHTRDDSPANLSPASLQHHGEYVLGLARQFGNLPLEQVTAPDAVYFNVPGFGLAHYPLAWSGPLAAAALALCAAALALGFRHRHLTVRGALGGAVAAAGVALVARRLPRCSLCSSSVRCR